MHSPYIRYKSNNVRLSLYSIFVLSEWTECDSVQCKMTVNFVRINIRLSGRVRDWSKKFFVAKIQITNKNIFYKKYRFIFNKSYGFYFVIFSAQNLLSILLVSFLVQFKKKLKHKLVELQSILLNTHTHPHKKKKTKRNRKELKLRDYTVQN